MSTAELNSTDPFLVNLTQTFHVKSIPLAIFILVLICLCCILILIMIIVCIRNCLRKRYALKRQRRKMAPVYIDEIPGLDRDEAKHKYGHLEYNLKYIVENNELKVGVILAEGLYKPAGVSSLDTYVTVTLLKVDGDQMKPCGKQECTHIIYRNERPCWHKVFSYTITESDLRHIIVIFELFNYDTVVQNVSIGKLQIRLKNIDGSKYAGCVFEGFGWLEQGNEISYGLGEMCIGLAIYPSTKRLDVCVYECRQLNLDKLFDNVAKIKELDVAVQVKCKQKTLKSDKTSSRKELVNPYFCKKMTFQLDSDNYSIEDLSVVCKLRYVDRLRFRHTLGMCKIGMDAVDSTGVKHWNSVMKGPCKMHVLWHIIN